VERPQPLPHGARAGAEGVARALQRLAHQRLAPAQHPTEHPHPIDEQAAVGRMVDRRLHHRPVDAQFAPPCDPYLCRQLDHAVIQGVQRVRPDGVCPAQQRGGVGHALKVDAAESAQHQAVGDALLRFAIAPIVEVLDNQEAQQHLDRRGMTPMAQRLGIPPAEVGADGSVEDIILEQGIKAAQHGVGLARDLGHAHKDIFWFVAINQHRAALYRGRCYLSLTCSIALSLTPLHSISQRQLILLWRDLC